MNKTRKPHQPTLDKQLCFAVHSAAHAFAQAYKPLLRPLKLTYPQYLVMLLLWEKDDQSVSELGEPLFLDSGTLTPLLKRLQTIGYITRNRDPKDERVTRINLTPSGKSLEAMAQDIHNDMLCATGLDVDNLSALRDSVQSLGQSLRATGSCREHTLKQGCAPKG